MLWDPGAARSEAENIRTWGQLGASGDWADAPIRPYGPPGLFPGGMSFFQIRVLGGADARAERLREFPDPAQLMAALSRDRRGIGYASLAYRTSEVKVLALAAKRGEPFIDLTRENVQTGRYPLARSIHIYLPPDAANGDPLVPPIAPKVREFLRYVLSQEGQRDVMRQGDFLPLGASMALQQLRKLDMQSHSRPQ